MDTPLDRQFIQDAFSEKNGGTDSVLSRYEALLKSQSGLYGEGETDKESNAGVVTLCSEEGIASSAFQTLFRHQVETITLIDQSVGSGANRLLVSMPTGAGKTRTAMVYLLERINKSKPAKYCWIAPSIELVKQAYDCAQDLSHKILFQNKARAHIGKIIISSGNKNLSEIFFITAQYAYRNLELIQKISPDLSVFDEAHQSVARTYKKVVEACVGEDENVILGLTATPGRVNDDESIELAEMFSDGLIAPASLGSSPVKSLQDLGVLSKINCIKIPIPSPWQDLRVKSKTVKYASVHELASNSARFWATVDCIAGQSPLKRCLVFCASIAHCCALSVAIEERGVSAGIISHTLADSDRSKVLEKFAEGKIDVLLNKSLLLAGYDCPSIENLVLATPMRSAISWEQAIGRVSRGPLVGGTEVGTVWELDDHKQIHSDLMSYQRYLREFWI